jgi:hypothetical protein
MRLASCLSATESALEICRQFQRFPRQACRHVLTYVFGDRTLRVDIRYDDPLDRKHLVNKSLWKMRTVYQLKGVDLNQSDIAIAGSDLISFVTPANQNSDNGLAMCHRPTVEVGEWM